MDEQALNYFLGHLHKIQTVQSPCALDYLTVSRCLKVTSTDEMHLKALSIAFREGGKGKGGENPPIRISIFWIETKN